MRLYLDAVSLLGIGMWRMSNSVNSRSFGMLCTPTTKLFERVHPSRDFKNVGKQNGQIAVIVHIACYQRGQRLYLPFVRSATPHTPLCSS
jgi:hypothetical protein